MSATSDSRARDEMRLLKLLNREGNAGCGYRREGNMAIVAAGERTYRFSQALVAGMTKQKLLTDKAGRLTLRSEGVSRLQRLLHPDMPYQAQNSTLAERQITTPGGPETVTVNESESPLARLHGRKDRSGRTWLDASQFQAGERFRHDFEQAGLQPRVSANWEASVASRSRSGNQAGDIADFVLDARNRFNRALNAVGPELSGVVVDVCCFLYGLEQVERARNWPPRSAKLMLRTGLDMLVRHYGLKSGTGRRPMRNWGTSDYRPEIAMPKESDD